MKSITLFLILFIAPLALSTLDDYSIDSFKNKVQSEGLFGLISSIKNNYGEDVAIISCEEFYKSHSGNCETLVKEYMSGGIMPNINLPDIDVKKQNMIARAIENIKRKKLNKNQLKLYLKKLKRILK